MLVHCFSSLLGVHFELLRGVAGGDTIPLKLNYKVIHIQQVTDRWDHEAADTEQPAALVLAL